MTTGSGGGATGAAPNDGGRVVDAIAIVVAVGVIVTLGLTVHWAAALVGSAVFAIDAKPAYKVYGPLFEVALPLALLGAALAFLSTAPNPRIVTLTAGAGSAALLASAVFAIVKRPDGKVFSTTFDVGVPGALLTAAVAFLGAAFDSPLAALSAVGVFVLGLVPQAKMKRSEMVSEMQKRFGELAGDKDAILGDWTVLPAAGTSGPSAPAGGTPPRLQRVQRMKKAAGAFYLRFWNLQLLEFGLWRYGMIPSDTYAHWVVRRLISFKNGTLKSLEQGMQESYWRRSPRRGWMQAQAEFTGTDFRYFMDVADRIRRETAKAGADADYELLHLRIERLLVAVSGSGLWSTFILRWFNARRPSLKGRSDDLVARSAKPLLRERRSAQGLFLLLAAACIVPAISMGREVRAYTNRFSDRPRTALVVDGSTSGGAVVLDPDQGPAPVFVVRFNEEGSCQGGANPRVWRGARLSGSSATFVDRVARGLDACHDAARPVRVDIVGFASSSQFSDLAACGPPIKDADGANLALAQARAENVAAVVRTRLPRDAVRVHEWNGAVAMGDERAIVDRIAGDRYDEARGSLNRRVEIRIISAGDCGRQ